MFISLFLDLHHYIANSVIITVRIIPTFYMLPFLNNSVLSLTIRIPVIILIACTLWPYPLSPLLLINSFDWWILILNELTIGLFIGCCLALPFWVFHAIGCIADNQRGAMMSSVMDPTAGIDTPELARFLYLFSSAVFLLNGGIMLILSTFSYSLQLCEPMKFCEPKLLVIFAFINNVVTKSCLLASPVITILLCVEVFLGLFSRFTPQLNAFSLLLTVKSYITIIVSIIYFTTILTGQVSVISFYPEMLHDMLKKR